MPIYFDPNQTGDLPNGTYTLRIVGVDEKTDKNGKDSLLIRLEETKTHNEVIEWITLIPKVMDWKFWPMWEAAGLQRPTAAGHIDEQQLVGHEVHVELVNDGQFGPKINRYVDAPVSDLPGQESFETGDPVTAGGQRYGQPPKIDDDDVPF